MPPKKSKQYSARTPDDLVSLAHQGEPAVFADLGDLLRRSGSKWTPRHLSAGRLLFGSEKELLSTFADRHNSKCAACKPNHHSNHKLRMCIVEALQNDDVDLQSKQSDLLRLPGGEFWSHLALACNPSRAGEARTYNMREDPAQHSEPDHVSSTTAIQGSSSPVHPESSEGYHTELEDIGDQDIDERIIPELTSRQLLYTFSRHVLHDCLDQEEPNVEISTRLESERFEARIGHFKANVVCLDDGGLGKFQRQRIGWARWRLDNPLLALFEAKGTLMRHREDPQTGETTPVLPDAILAQYFAEAVLAWLAYPKLLHQEFSTARMLAQTQTMLM
ncbi:hypothetical protein NQ176_g1694 [Zarea fungicola]|uniref:Uncharacterized protein n=1 Tax=Zarea fungicola TaxID=93591 RepID=A0ACC1NU13_9HYPO|nr:hypothetical protein NQ176_g1694 [Lecanicillium fungicola]